MDNPETFRIQFENLSVAEAGRQVSQLRDLLIQLSPDVKAEIVKDTQSTQDLGTILVLFFKTGTAAIVAKGIANYLSRVGSSIVITKDNEIIAKNIRGKDIAKIIEALSKNKKGKK